MNLTKNDNPALLLIDVQKGFKDIAYWGGERNNLDAEDNMQLLLKHWRKNNLPVFHIKHCSVNPVSPLAKGTVGNDFKDFIVPETKERIIEKNVITTDHCVSTTTRMAGNFGFDTYLVEDAVATFNKIGTNGQEYSAQLIHDTAIASLKDEFATIIKTHTLLSKLI